MTRRSMDDMAVDPRNSFQMLSRAECRKILTEKGITFDPGITQIDAVILLQANKVDPREAMPWEQIVVKNADGKESIKSVPLRTDPVRPEGHDERAMAEVDRLSAIAIEEEKKTEKKVETLQDEISQLKVLVTQLIEQKQETAFVEEVSVTVQEKPKEVDPYKMKFMAQRKWLKAHGVELPKGGNAKELIAAVLEKENVENTVAGNERGLEESPDRQLEQPADITH